MIRTIWECQPGEYFCIARKTKDGRWRDHFFTRDRWNDAQALIERRKDLEDVYFVTNGLNGRGRRSCDFVWGVWLYADLDAVRPSSLSWGPTLAIRSSPGRYQAWWRCDGVVNGELNQRLTYAVGADRGGWSGNKLLRVAGTVNFKYAALPRVALVHDGGPTYSVRDLSRTLPQPRKSATRGGGGVSVEGLMRWASVRTCMGPAREGMRSTMIARLIYALHEKGADRDGIAWALLRCPSFIDKRGEDLEKALGEIDNCLRNGRCD